MKGQVSTTVKLHYIHGVVGNVATMKKVVFLLIPLLALVIPLPAPAVDETFTESRAGMEFVLVPGGTYRMGDFTRRGLAQEQPAHPVTVSDFYLGRHEVTVAQFRTFVAATGYKTDAERAGGVVDIDYSMMTTVRRPGISWSAPGFPSDDANPVVWVTWNDAAEYARWLAQATGRPYRLPTEAEWEYAARERGRDLPWSGTSDPNLTGEYVWFTENSGGVPHPVGGKKPNAIGLYDLSGNVWEWCLDWQEAYRGADKPTLNPRGPAEGQYRALRGGSWRVAREVVRTTYRNGYRPDYAHSSIGFRLALEIRDRI